MKKWIASILAVLLTTAGYAFVDQALIDRVDTLEVQVASLRAEINPDPTEPVPKPNATYLQKYVIDILNSGTYTAKFAVNYEGTGSVPITMYTTSDKMEIKMNVGQPLAQALHLPSAITKFGDIRLIETDKTGDPQRYLAFPGGYCKIETDDEEIKEMIKDMDLSTLPAQLDALQYFGVNTYSGYAVEKYKEADANTMYRFYFDSQGFSKVDVVDLATRTVLESMPVRLSAGVTDRDAFKLTGKEITIGEIQSLIGDLVG